VQRAVGRALSPLWLPLCVAVMRFGFAWRIEGARETRRLYRRLRRESSAPLLVCANHLTLVDSFLVAWALGSPGSFLADWASLPWNTPDRENFASRLWQRALIYVMRCIPVRRGGSGREIARSLARVAHVLRRGEVALIFPEGGRSRSGRVDAGASTTGAGRVVKSVGDCRVLCVYLRGESQASWSARPRRGERFRVRAECFEPKTDRVGLRGSLDLTRQILARLARLESEHFGEVR
jgi:1-acyl-sn-glycerol-3-phosphate acyltransferase